ncbi:MAG: phosphoglyceromutase [Chloroflexi bacterium]|nr:MAG: phosphoglyceromutase [Chloroflexota bacterium]
MGYTLVLLRHGQSTWNLENRFTGWIDVPLSDLGREEAVTAGRQLKQAGIKPDVVHTSLLLRAIDTAQIALAEMGLTWLPVKRSWRLNERHYGALQGLDKAETAARHGEKQVQAWRRSYDIQPPGLRPGDPDNPASDARYRDLAPDLKPATECLKDVVERMLPYWYDAIVPDLRDGRRVLVSAHGNSLRALVKHLDGISEEDIAELNLPTGIPLVYELDGDMRPLRRGGDYLDPVAAAASIEAVKNQGRR